MEKINPKFKFVNVIGCGFAGIETAMFLARHGVKVHVFNIVFEKENIGGKITSSPMVANYPGFIDVPGMEIADNLYSDLYYLQR